MRSREAERQREQHKHNRETGEREADPYDGRIAQHRGGRKREKTIENQHDLKSMCSVCERGMFCLCLFFALLSHFEFARAGSSE